MDKFNPDQFARHCLKNIWYPFAGRADWQMASFLSRSSLSKAALDEFFSLEAVSDSCFRCQLYLIFYFSQTKSLPISFHSADELRERMELLPQTPS